MIKTKKTPLYFLNLIKIPQGVPCKDSEFDISLFMWPFVKSPKVTSRNNLMKNDPHFEQFSKKMVKALFETRLFRLALNRMSRLIEQLLLIDIEWLETSPTKLNCWKEVRELLIYFRAVNWFDFDSNSWINWHWNKPDKASFKIMDRRVVAFLWKTNDNNPRLQVQ